MRNNIYKSCAQVTAFSVFEKGLSFLYRIALTRIIGAEGVGMYQICLTVFAVFLTLSSSGIPVTVSRLMAISSAKNDQTGKHSAVSAGIATSLVMTLTIAAVLFVFKDSFSFLFADPRCLPIFMILIPGLVINSVYAVIRGSFWGNRQFLPYSVIELIEDAIMVVVGTILIWNVNDPVVGATRATVAVLVSYVFSFAASLFWYFKKGGKLVNPKPQLKPLLKSATPITAMRTLSSLLSSAVAVIIPFMLINFCSMNSSQALSQYGVVMGMAIPMLFIPTSLIGSITVVVAPELTENYYSGRKNAVKFDIEKSVRSSIFIAAIIIPILFSLADAMGMFLYGEKMCGDIVKASCFIVLPMCICMMTNSVLNSLNCEKQTLVYFCIGGVCMLVCILALTPFIGIYSYVVGLCVNYLLTAALNTCLLKKKCPQVSFANYTVRTIAIIALASVFGSTLVSIFDNFMGSFFQILCAAPLIVIFTAVGMYMLGLYTLTPLKKLISRDGKREKKCP